MFRPDRARPLELLLLVGSMMLAGDVVSTQKQTTPPNELPSPYETVRNWGTLPPGRTWGSTGAVAIDRDGLSVWAIERCGSFSWQTSGRVSCAGSNLDPVLTQLESTGKFVAVADSRTEKGMKEIYGGDYHASVIYITDEFIKKNPNTVQAVVNAMVRANRWISKATPQEIVDLMPDAYKAANPSLYKEALLKNMIGYSEDGQMSMKAAENVYKVLVQFEPSVKAAGKMDLSATFDNTYARKAAAKYR